MKQELLIVACSDSQMWYANLVGQRVPFVRDVGDCYISREPAGWTNIVHYEDAVLVDEVNTDE